VAALRRRRLLPVRWVGPVIASLLALAALWALWSTIDAVQAPRGLGHEERAR